jgi:hypothetical protein
MIRYFTFVSIVIFGAASALAAMAPRHYVAANSSTNVTVVAKNQAFPAYGPLVFEACNQEDCSDVTE